MCFRLIHVVILGNCSCVFSPLFGYLHTASSGFPVRRVFYCFQFHRFILRQMQDRKLCERYCYRQVLHSTVSHKSFYTRQSNQAQYLKQPFVCILLCARLSVYVPFSLNFYYTCILFKLVIYICTYFIITHHYLSM